jgi:hypothetical protein
MTSIEAAEALVGLLGTSAFFGFWLGPWRWAIVDWARDNMFAARDKFFDVAASGGIGFEDPRYCKVRNGINAHIRFAHALTLVRMICHYNRVRRHPDQGVRNGAREAASQIEDMEVRAAAVEALDKAESASLWLMFGKSPILSILMLMIVVRPRITIEWLGGKPDLRGKLQPYADLIQAEAPSH